ncbi:hypothetical protein OXYTRIMIC_243 [Oxytricha trifallax]|uniref:Endonuclease/exonuclease/phosphatase domain-containing protein n=1 Tax=Oxytricha trifallax TaxID=1172189 RepID=A0A073IC35_9SPIT|nr:hypothetical protein OXYTRIMIC_243 [Oxytricha trifallax]
MEKGGDQMEAGQQQRNGRRILPVYMDKENSNKTINQKSFKDYFESSSVNANIQKIYNHNVQIQQQKKSYKDLDNFSVKLNNGRQLQFYQPQREVEGWVRRTERFAENQRSKRREQTINNKRQIALQSIKLNICLQNVRGMNSKLKQDQLMREIEYKQPDLIGLVETRLTRMIGINNKNIADLTSQEWRSSGAEQWEIPYEYNKNTKVIYRLDYTEPYIPPYCNDEVKELQNRLMYMIITLKQKCQKQRIIVMGDFNFHIKELGKRLNTEGLRESIPVGVETHTKGNQLDQIFSNVETASWETCQLKQTDHKLVQVKLKIKFHENDFKLSDREQQIRISDIRKQCWQTFMNEKRELTLEDLDQPIQKCFVEKLERHFKGKNWYQQPPE